MDRFTAFLTGIIERSGNADHISVGKIDASKVVGIPGEYPTFQPASQAARTDSMVTQYAIPTIDEVAKVTNWIVEARAGLGMDQNDQDLLLKKLLAALTVFRMDPWISVSECLPDRDVSVLAFAGYRTLAWIDWRLGNWRANEGPVDVTHWMPLPEPPEGVC